MKIRYKLYFLCFSLFLIIQIFRITVLLGVILSVLFFGYCIYKLALLAGKFMRDDKFYNHK